MVLSRMYTRLSLIGVVLAPRKYGQAKAPTSASSASVRSANRIRSRNRTGLRRGSGWSSRNRSAENCTTLVSFLRRKCSQIGAASASAPSKNHGFRKEKGISLFQPLSFREKHRQRAPGIFIRAHNAVGHLQAAEQVPMRAHERVEPRQVFFARRFGTHNASYPRFQILEQVRFRERKFQLIAIQHLENDYLMAMKTKLFQTQRHFLGWFEQIRKEQDNAAPMHQPNGVLDQLRQASAPARRQPFELPQHQPELI